MPKTKRVFSVAAITSGLAWLTKVAFIAAFGDNLAVALLWGLGMISFLVAAGAGTALLLRRTPVWARIVAAVIAVPVAFILLDVLDAGVKAIYSPDGWIRDEVGLLIGGVLMAVAGVMVMSGRNSRTFESA